MPCVDVVWFYVFPDSPDLNLCVTRPLVNSSKLNFPVMERGVEFVNVARGDFFNAADLPLCGTKVAALKFRMQRFYR